MSDPIFTIPPDFRMEDKVFPMASGDLSDYWEQQRWLTEIQKLIEITNGCRNVKIGIVDTGFDYRHPQCRDVNMVSSKSFVDNSDGIDRNGHGTIVAHQIFRVCPNAQFYIAKVLSDRGSGPSTAIMAGCQWLAEQGCHFINGSLGSGSPYNPMKGFLESYKREGVCFFATGNSGRNEMGYPAGWGPGNGMFPIGAYDQSYRRASFSQVGTKMLACGAGVNIRAPKAGSSGETSASGTSMGTPHHVSLSAILTTVFRRKGYGDSLFDMLEGRYDDFMTDMGEPGRDRDTGFGYLDPGKILKFAEADDVGL